METNCNSTKLLNSKISKMFSGRFIVDAIGTKCGLALFWTDSAMVDILAYSLHHIVVSITPLEYQYSWNFIGFYGDPIWKINGEPGICYNTWELKFLIIYGYVEILMRFALRMRNLEVELE